jgi:hypothetical protein
MAARLEDASGPRAHALYWRFLAAPVAQSALSHGRRTYWRGPKCSSIPILCKLPAMNTSILAKKGQVEAAASQEEVVGAIEEDGTGRTNL